MNYNVYQSSFDKEVLVPTSKSYANRLLILGSVSKKKIKIKGLPQSTDVLSMLKCLKKIGLMIDETETKMETEAGIEIEILNSFPECERNDQEVIELETGDGGTTNRFLIPLLARGKKKYLIKAKGHMKKRPMDELITILKAGKVKIQGATEKFWMSVQGPFQSEQENIAVNCLQTTQFATGLALSFYDYPFSFILKNMASSKKYFDITENLIQEISHKNSFNIPVDFSSLSYPLAAAMTDGHVLVKNCFERDPAQADSVLCEIIKKCGGELRWTKKGLEVFGAKTYLPLHEDCAHFPDLVPTLIYLASYAHGESFLKNIKVLRYKESDRIDQCLKLLTLFEVEHHYSEDQDILAITGRAPFRESQTFKAPDDHRIIMVAYLFMKFNGGGLIKNAIHVKKSFPLFFKTM